MKLFALLGLLGFGVSAPAEVYRWVDSNGAVHYGDRAATQQASKAEPVPISESKAILDPEAEKTRQQLHQLEQFRQEQQQSEAQQTAQWQAQQNQMAQRCKSIQNDIRYDQQVAVMFSYDDAGNRVIWSADRRVAYKEKLQALKQQYCGGQTD